MKPLTDQARQDLETELGTLTAARRRLLMGQQVHQAGAKGKTVGFVAPDLTAIERRIADLEVQLGYRRPGALGVQF